MPERRFVRSKRFNRNFADAPGEIKQTISNALAMLAEGHTKPGPSDDTSDDPDPPESILRFTEMKGWGFQGEWIAALGNVLIRYFIPGDHPVIILNDLIWLDG